MMRIERATIEDLERCAGIPIAFEVRETLEVSCKADGVFELVLQEVPKPWIKNYDIEGSPASLSDRFDIRNWGIFMAMESERLVGGCIVAFNTPGCEMLEGRIDLGVLWDMRVAPECRGRGIGRMLFTAAKDWAEYQNCSEIQVETQNINVPACRFYEKMGCRLLSVSKDAYEDCPGEDRLIWGMEISC